MLEERPAPLMRWKRRRGIKPSDGPSDGDDGAGETAFIHRATDENSRGDYTSITRSQHRRRPARRRPCLAGHGAGRRRGRLLRAQHRRLVRRPWPTSGRSSTRIWQRCLRDPTFEVVVAERASAGFVHQADPSNTAGNYTYLDNRLTNGKPDAVLSVTQNWNPGGGSGVYNDHPVGAIYDPQAETMGDLQPGWRKDARGGRLQHRALGKPRQTCDEVARFPAPAPCRLHASDRPEGERIIVSYDTSNKGSCPTMHPLPALLSYTGSWESRENSN